MIDTQDKEYGQNELKSDHIEIEIEPLNGLCLSEEPLKSDHIEIEIYYNGYNYYAFN